MNKFFTICKTALALAVVCLMASCKQDGLSGTDGFTATLTLLSDTSLQRTVPCTAGSYTVNFSTNKYWNATLLLNAEEVAETTLSPVSGSPGDNVSLTFYLPANRTYSAKVYHLTITANDVAVLLEITQLAYDQETQLTVNPTTLAYESEGSALTFTIESNVDWTLSDVPTWCTVTPLNGKADDVVTVTATAGANTGDAREATMTVSAGDITKNVTLTQKRPVAPGSVSTADTVWFAAEGGTKGMELTASASWTAQAKDSWCTVTPTQGNETEGTDVVLTLGANNGTQARETEVLFYIGQDVKHRTVVLQCPPLNNTTWDLFVKDILTGVYYTNMSYQVPMQTTTFSLDDTLSLSFSNNKAYIDGQEASYKMDGRNITIMQTYTSTQNYSPSLSTDSDPTITRRFTLDSLRLNLQVNGYLTAIESGTLSLSTTFYYDNPMYMDDEKTEILFDESYTSTITGSGKGSVTGQSPKQYNKTLSPSLYEPVSGTDPALPGNFFKYLYSIQISEFLYLINE